MDRAKLQEQITGSDFFKNDFIAKAEQALTNIATSMAIASLKDKPSHHTFKGAYDDIEEILLSAGLIEIVGGKLNLTQKGVETVGTIVLEEKDEDSS